MNMLVTGGLGFQGERLVRHWRHAGHDVAILSTPSERAVAAERRLWDDGAERLRVVWGSVTDPEVVQKAVAGCGVVAHLAAWTSVDQSFAHPRATFRVNAEAAYTVLEAVRLHAPRARVLWASSCEVYGHTGDAVATEDAPLRPHSPYAASKVAGERLAYSYAVTYGLEIAILRPCNIFGPWQKAGPGGAVIPTFIAAALRGESLVMTGTGEQCREFLYVDDLVAAYDAVFEATWLPGAVFNVGSGETRSVREIARAVGDRYGALVLRSAEAARPGEVRAFRLDSSRLRALGWFARDSFHSGLEATMRWADAARAEAGA